MALEREYYKHQPAPKTFCFLLFHLHFEACGKASFCFGYKGLENGHEFFDGYTD